MPSSGARSEDSTLTTRSCRFSSMHRQSVNVPPRSMKKSTSSRSALVEQPWNWRALLVHAAQIKGDRAVVGAHDDVPTMLELAEEQLVTERLFDFVLDQAS